MKIHRIIYNTVVKREKNTEDDRYAAVGAAIAIKEYGSNSAFKTAIKKAEKEKTTIKPKIPENIWITTNPSLIRDDFNFSINSNKINHELLKY